ncbi:MAG TPA: 50S ribosomal protein L9 [Nitriliruptorales bacterium]
MKLILKQEVDNLGLAGDVVDVAAGYGRNFLLPRGLAIKATSNAMREAAVLTRARKAREAHTLDDAQEQKAALETRTYVVPARVDDAGHLYGSVRVEDIHRVIKDRGHEVEKRRIDLKSPIKVLGTYEIEVHVHPQVSATIEVEVVDEEGKVVVDASGRVIGDEPAQAPVSIEEQALEAAAEIEGVEELEVAGSDEGIGSALDPTPLDPTSIQPTPTDLDQPPRPDELVDDATVEPAGSDEDDDAEA